MKNVNKRILPVLLALLLLGCAAVPAETEPVTTPVLTQPPTDPPTDPPTQAPTEPEPDYGTLFCGGGEWMYNLAAGHPFSRPEEVSLYHIFYNGVGYEGSWGSLSEADRELLRQEGFWDEIDIQIMPAGWLEEMLRRYFGVGLDDVRIPDEWAYSAASDMYFSNHNDAYGQSVTVMGHERLPDGTVVRHLMVDVVGDGEDWVWDAAMDMTLRPGEDGYQMISNVWAP